MTNSQSRSEAESNSRQAGGIAGEIERYVAQLLEAWGLELTAAACEDGGSVAVNLTGADRPLLLGNTAAVLNSLEYLVNMAFRTGRRSRIAAIAFDSDNYRQQREAELVLLAKMASERVIAQRKPMVLQPMTPRERRIVHLALAEIEGVQSQSSGEGDNRSITISLSE